MASRIARSEWVRRPSLAFSSNRKGRSSAAHTSVRREARSRLLGPPAQVEEMPCALPAAATSMPVLRRCRGLRARGWMAILAATVTGAVVHLDARAQRRRAVRVAHANVAHWEMQGRGVTFDDQLRRRGRE